MFNKLNKIIQNNFKQIKKKKKQYLILTNYLSVLSLKKNNSLNYFFDNNNKIKCYFFFKWTELENKNLIKSYLLLKLKKNLF